MAEFLKLSAARSSKGGGSRSRFVVGSRRSLGCRTDPPRLREAEEIRTLCDGARDELPYEPRRAHATEGRFVERQVNFVAVRDLVPLDPITCFGARQTRSQPTAGVALRGATLPRRGS